MNNPDFKAMRASMYKKQLRKSRMLFWRFFMIKLASYVLIMFLLNIGIYQRAFFILYLIPFFLIICFDRLLQAKTKLAAALIITRGFKQEFAEEIIQRNKSYLIYLREFFYEDNYVTRFYFSGSSFGAQFWKRPGSESKIEKLIIGLLNKNLPVLALANVKKPLPVPGAHRFFHQPVDWQAFLQQMLPAAKLIIVYITYLTPGILTELEILKTKDFAQRTIIIIGKSKFARENQEGRAILSTLGVFNYIVFEQSRNAIPTRKDEKIFHKDLIKCLLTVESENNIKIMADSQKNLPYEHPSFFKKCILIVIEPVLWTIAAFPLCQIIVNATVDKILIHCLNNPSFFLPLLIKEFWTYCIAFIIFKIMTWKFL